MKDTLQTEMSDVRLNEVQMFISVVVLLLQCADGVTLRSHEQVLDRRVQVHATQNSVCVCVCVYLGTDHHHWYPQVVCECVVS